MNLRHVHGRVFARTDPRIGLCAALSAALVAGSAAASEQEGSPPNPVPPIARSLDFIVIYPQFLRFRIGADGANNVNGLVFTVPASAVGANTKVDPAGGDAALGQALNVELSGNGGQITITATNNTGGTGLGTGNPSDGYVDFAQISTSSNVPELPAPVLDNAGGSISIPALGGKNGVTRRTAVWSYHYVNSTVPSPGTYAGSVRYAATMP